MSRHRREDNPAEVTLPITPMLDMAFQLMFFFLATFNPVSQKEGQMALSLPSRSDRPAPSPDQIRPTSEPHREEVAVPADITISLRGFQDPRSKGQISALTLTTTAGTETLNGTQEERVQLLRQRLTAAAAESKKATVRVEGERDLRWSQIVAVLDVCYRAGFQVSFVKPADLGGR